MSKMNEYYRLIDADHVTMKLRLREVWDYRYLIYILTRKRLTVRYKQTILGPLWQFLNPLITSFFHIIIFGTIAGISTD